MCQTDEGGSVVSVQGETGDGAERTDAEAARSALCGAILQLQEPAADRYESLGRLLQTARTVLELEHVHLLLADRDGERLCAVASLGVEQPLEAVQVPIGPEGGAIAQTYRTRQAAVRSGPGPILEPLRLVPPYDQSSVVCPQAFALIPLVVEERAIGVLIVDRKPGRRPLDSTTLALLQPFAVLAALVITRDRQYGDRPVTSNRLRETNILNMIENAISGSLGLDNILDQALAATVASLQMDVGEIFLFDAARGEASKTRHLGQDQEVFAEHLCFALGEGIPGRVVQAGECFIIPDLAADRRFVRHRVVTAGYHTFAAVPLTVKGRVIGCLGIAGRRPSGVTAADLHLLTAVGAVIGLAVANGSLYEDLWIETKRLEAKIEELLRAQDALLEIERLRESVPKFADIAKRIPLT